MFKNHRCDKMVKMTTKEKMYTKAQKMTDLLLDSIPMEGGEKDMTTKFYDYRDNFEYELSIKIKKSFIEPEENAVEEGTIVYDADGTAHFYDSDGDEVAVIPPSENPDILDTPEVGEL